MKRRRRKRSTRRRGMQHIGDILAELLTEIDGEEDETAATPESRRVPVPASNTETAGQGTFAFYQPVEV
ncbi:MAG: hypothetical protein ACR2NP_20925 [Pirellulaceae bacterium]